MGKYLQFIVAFVYFLCCFGTLYFPLTLIFKFSSQQTVFIFIATFLTCLSSAYWRTWLHLLQANVRQPIAEERELLGRNFNIVLDRCSEQRRFRMLIEESKNLSASALGINTIIISRAMLDELSDGELQAVMAHELGHLRSRDSFIQAFIITAGCFPKMLELAGKLFWKLFRPGLTNIYVLMLVLTVFTWLVYMTKINIRIFLYLVVAILLVKFLRLLFYYSWLAVMRFTEYRQDAFATSLGYADDLRAALLKLIKDGAGNISIWHTWQHGSHPISYNRIRKLERSIERLKTA